MTAPAPPILSVRQLSRSFGGVRAVDQVSFDVAEGEILGLIGPNGSGKSTLFNCVLGQLAPDSGTVGVSGRDVTGLSPSRLNRLGIARTFQMLQVFARMSVLDNIILAGQEHRGTMLSRLAGPPDAGLTAQADDMIAFFNLTRLRDEMAGALSYGQQKLLDVATALMAGPRLVLLDEPAGGVNLTMLETLKQRLLAFHRQNNTTFVVIEHNMEFVMSLCSRIIVMANGAIIAEGSPGEIRANSTVIDAYLGD